VIHQERIQLLNERPVRQTGRYVLYWMQQSQRASSNHALELAIREADAVRLPVVAVFGVTQRFPQAQLRHYAFMLEGLEEAEETLRRRGIRFVVSPKPPPQAVADLAGHASLVVADRGYLRIQRAWRKTVADKAPCRVVQVESDVVVPVETASDKEEYAARTIRPKIQRHLARFLVPLKDTKPARDSLSIRLPRVDRARPGTLLRRLRVPSRAGGVQSFRGGTSEARRHLRSFLRGKLASYETGHSDPGADGESHLSPYLHFGQISPLEIALAVRRARGVSRKDKAAFLEELIVRRELSMNFCHYNEIYDDYACVPEWARRTLRKHGRNRREYVYSRGALERARTHDPYWNAAQREMVLTGKMHGYMRMYWGKKIIEWTRSPEEAFRTALWLNNTYELDGRDPNSFAGVAWCFGKHDRPWGERRVFGTVRWMSAEGLKRKFNMESYVSRIEALGEVS
jgi:deoxyribodipyrimidine photo-lyase